MRGRMPGSVKAAVLLASVTLALLTGFEVSREAYSISRILVHAEGLEGASVVLTASAANIVFQLTCGLLIALLVFAVIIFGIVWRFGLFKPVLKHHYDNLGKSGPRKPRKK